MDRNIIWDLILLSVGLLIFVGFILAKEYRKAKIWIILTFGIPILFFILIFISKISIVNSLFKEYWPVIGFSIFLLLLIYMPIYLFVVLKDYFYRPFQMKKIAQKYNLNYIEPKRNFIEIDNPPEIQKNILEGKINDKDILIYDFIDMEAYPYGLNGFSRKITICSVNGVKNEIKGFITGFGSVKKIDNFLNDLAREK